MYLVAGGSTVLFKFNHLTAFSDLQIQQDECDS